MKEQMYDWDQMEPDIERKLCELFDKIDRQKKQKFIGLWEKLDPIDPVYYQYSQNAEERYQYYLERFVANKKFQNKIEEIFEPGIYDIDAKSTLEMWRLLIGEEKSGSSALQKFRWKTREWQKTSIQKKLQKYAREGIAIKEDQIEAYLELLVGQKKRQKLILEAEETVPAELLIYFDQHGEQMKEMKERCLILDYCMGKMSNLGLEKEEITFWQQWMLSAATKYPETILFHTKELIKRMGE